MKQIAWIGTGVMGGQQAGHGPERLFGEGL